MGKMGLGILWAIALSGGGQIARADDLGIDIRLGCEEAFRILPGPMMFHDQVSTDYQLDELGNATKEVEALLKSGRYFFPTAALPLQSTQHLFTGDSIRREQLEIYLRALKNLARLILFQSNWVAAFCEWVNEEPVPTLKKTRNLSDQAAKDGAPLRKSEAKSKRVWLESEAAAEFRRIEGRTAAKQPRRHLALNGADRQHLYELENEMEAHHEIPEYFLIWMSGHSRSARHYETTESSLYFELVEDLHELFGLTHHP